MKSIRLSEMIGKLVIIIMIIILIYPIIWLITSTFKSPAEIAVRPIYALPEGIYLQNYIKAWTIGNMSVYVINSAITTFSALFFIALLSSTAAYSIQILKWKLSSFALNIFLVGIMIPVQVVLIPLFIMYKAAGVLNTLTSLVISYTAFGLPLAIYLFTGYLKYLNRHIMESAIIDGCSIYSMFWRIILPVSKNAFLTIMTLQFFMHWNNYIFPATFISRIKLRTIQTGLMSFTGEYGEVDWGPTFAAVTIAIFPTLFIYLFMSKMIIRGMTAGAIKG